MKRISLLGSTASLGALLFACGGGGSDQLLPGGAQMAMDPTSLAAGDGNTQHHYKESIGADNGVLDEQQQQADDQAVGSPEAVARLHGTMKIRYDVLGTMLADFGVNLQAANGAGALYMDGSSALGAPVFANRVPEQNMPSTSALAKEFDIFSAAAPEIVLGLPNSKRCPGVALFDSSGQFTMDGISCLLGKPAKAEHVSLANQIMTEATTPQIGQQIAIATLLAAAHTSE